MGGMAVLLTVETESIWLMAVTVMFHLFSITLERLSASEIHDRINEIREGEPISYPTTKRILHRKEYWYYKGDGTQVLRSQFLRDIHRR